jgi:hypothetical protein
LKSLAYHFKVVMKRLVDEWDAGHLVWAESMGTTAASAENHVAATAREMAVEDSLN